MKIWKEWSLFSIKFFFGKRILSSRKTSRMFFNLHSKIMLLDFHLVVIITVAIRLQFWTDFYEIHMVGAGPHMGEPYSCYKQSAQQNHRWRKMCPRNRFFDFPSACMGFFEEKTSNRIRYPIFRRIGYIHFCRPTPHSRKTGHACQKLFFVLILAIIVFIKKIVEWKIFKNSFPTKKCWLLPLDVPSFSKQSCTPTDGFLQFFQCKLKNIHKVLLLESILIRKKILWRINFVLIKFSLNALLFEKSQNEWKNLSSLREVTRIKSNYIGAVAKFNIHGSPRH